jgi:predicted ATPase
MKRYILTGTPGSGKTSLIRTLEREGYAVVEEAATDVIAHEQSRGNREPWKQADFIDKTICLQKQRQMQASEGRGVQFYDRSPICTLALARYLRYQPSDALMDEIERIRRENIYQKQVFFVQQLGFCAPTNARTISMEEAAVFEEIHWETYQSLEYECIKIAPGTISERTNTITDWLAQWNAINIDRASYDFLSG